MKEKIQNARWVSLQSILLILLLIVGVGIIVLLQTKTSSYTPVVTPRLAKGVSAPIFTLPNMGGERVSLVDYKGKVVLLNIWATWCPPCVEEMPSMEKLHQALKDEGLEILAVSIDVTGAEVVAPFMKTHRLNFTALFDTKGAVRDLYRTTGVPETFIIDTDGKIADIIIGPRDWASPRVIEYFRNLIQRN